MSILINFTVGMGIIFMRLSPLKAIKLDNILSPKITLKGEKKSQQKCSWNTSKMGKI